MFTPKCTSTQIDRLSGNSITWEQVGLLPGTSTSFADSQLLCGTAYLYRLRAVNSAGVSPFVQTELTTTAPCLTPTQPGILAIDKFTQTGVTISWKAGVYVQIYKIERQTGLNGQWGEIAQVYGYTLVYSDIGLNPGTLYRYRIRSSNPLAILITTTR